MFKYSFVDTLLINLNVISKINANEKICVNQSGKIGIHQESKYYGIYRWVFGENRMKCISFINNLINDTIDKIYEYQKSDCDVEKRYENELVIGVNNACTGLENLKITYDSDTYIVSYIESIIKRIQLHIKIISDGIIVPL
tara:strand:- start:491 stop:913 length:423 start_codon:yes stop_codon:yes gene_type:complete